MKKLFLSLFFFLFAASAQAATYYVATTGSNTNCTTIQTIGTPALTVNFALDCFTTGSSAAAGAGHTVQVAAGTYAEAINNNIPSGNSSNPFILKCVTARACTLTGKNAQGEVIAFNSGAYTAHWIVVDGFILDGGSTSGSDGVRMSAADATHYQNIIFQNLKIQNMGSFGFLAGSGTNITIQYTQTTNLCVVDATHFCHAIYLGGFGFDWLIQHNHITGFSGYGIHVYAPENRPARAIIRNNRIFGGVLRGPIIIYGPNHTIYNNVLYGSGGIGVEVHSTASGAQIINNVIYDNDSHGISVVAGNSAKCANNIILANGGSAISGTCATNTTNLTSGTPTDIMIDPANADFNLKESSAAINAGTSIAASGNWPGSSGRFVGGTPDQGAFEAPTRLSAEVPDANQDNYQITYAMPAQSVRGGVGLQGALAANYAIVVNAVGATEDAAAIVGTNRVDIDLSANVTAGHSLTDAYTRGTLTDNLCIGDPNVGCLNAKPRTYTAAAGVNNVSVAAAGFTALHYRCMRWYGDTTPASTDWLRAEDASNTLLRCPIRAGGLAAVAVAITSDIAIDQAFEWHANRNGGAYAALTNTTSATAIAFAAVNAPAMADGEEIASAILTDPNTDYVVGKVVAQQASQPIVVFNTTSTTNVILLVKSDASTVVGDVFCIQPATAGLTPTSVTQTATPCFEIVEPGAGY